MLRQFIIFRASGVDRPRRRLLAVLLPRLCRSIPQPSAAVPPASCGTWHQWGILAAERQQTLVSSIATSLDKSHMNAPGVKSAAERHRSEVRSCGLVVITLGAVCRVAGPHSTLIDVDAQHHI